MKKFWKINKLHKINIKLNSIIKSYLKIINFINLKKINNINKWNNKMMKLKDHLNNFLKIYMKIMSVNNKYLKLLLTKSKKTFKTINNNLINNSLKI